MRMYRTICPIVAFFLITVPSIAFAASVAMKWKANSEPDVAGYHIYYGTKSRQYGPPIPVGKVTSYSIGNLVNGTTYYFALTAIDTSGNESGYSTEASSKATTTTPTPTAPSSGSGFQSIKLATSMSSPQPEGRIIQLGAQTTGTGLAYEYMFQIRKTGKSKWKVLRNYTTEPSYMWDTSGKKGNWDIRVKVRDQNNPAKLLGVNKIKKFKITP